MNRTLVAVLAALEAFVAVAIGIGISLVPLTVLWAVQYHLTPDWAIFWRISGDVWLLGHGVNVTIANPGPLVSTTIEGLGTLQPFQLTIAALGFALLTVLFGIRTGLRATSTRYPQTAIVVSVAVFLVFGAGIGLATRWGASGVAILVEPSLYQSVLLPAGVNAIGLAIGAGLGRAALPDAEHSSAIAARVADAVRTIPATVRLVTAAALRAGTAASAMVLAVSGIVLAIVLAAHFGSIVALYESLHSGGLGGAVLTLGQLALLPNFAIWVMSWLVGPGFAIGTGSSVSPSGTELGPLPSLPVFAALPQHVPSLAFAGLIVPVLAALVGALLTRRRVDARRAAVSPVDLVCAGLGAGIVAGVELGLLAWWSSGALGPGRLHTVGPDPLMVGVFAAAEVAVASVVGMFAGARRT